jgi:hypothetical protein
MKRHIFWLGLLLVAPASAVYASDVAFNAGFSVGVPGAAVSFGVGTPAYPYPAAPSYPPAYPYQGASAYPYQPVAIEEPPMFVQPPELGFYAAVGLPYDLFFLNNLFYLFFGNAWYSSPYYNGPWSNVYAYDVPYVLNRYPFERIRHYRDDYYGRYQRYGAWDGYRHFRPDRHDAGREGYGRARYDYSRPTGPGHAYGERPSYARPNGYGQGYGDRPRYAGPNNYGQGYGDRQSYARPNNTSQWYGNRPMNARPNNFNTGQGYGNRPSYSRPDNSAQFYGNRPVYTRPNSAGQSYGDRPSFSRPSNSVQANMARPVYSRPNSQGHGGGNTVAYSRPNNFSQGFGGGSRPSFSRPNTGGHAYGGGSGSSRPTSTRQSEKGRSGGSEPRGFGHGGGERHGHGR